MYTYNLPSTNKLEEFEKYNYLFISLRGVFLALILFCASFLTPYIGCNYQYILKTNKYVRYLVLFLVIYFSINLVNPNLKSIENPFIAVSRSIFVFFIFILLNKIPVTTIVLTMTMFALLVFSSKYYMYLKEDYKNNNLILDTLQIIQWVLVIFIILLLFISLFQSNNTNHHGTIELKKCNI